MARTPRGPQPAATTAVVPSNGRRPVRKPQIKWTDEEEVYARRLMDDFRNGRTSSLRDGKTLGGYLAGMLGRTAKSIAKHFGALGRRGFRKLLTPTPAEAQEVADLRTAFLDARAARARTVATNRARPAGPRRTGPTQAQKDDAWRAAKAFNVANAELWKRAEGDAAALRLLRDGRRARRRGPPAIERQPTPEESQRLVDLAYVGTSAHAQKQLADGRRADAEAKKRALADLQARVARPAEGEEETRADRAKRRDATAALPQAQADLEAARALTPAAQQRERKARVRDAAAAALAATSAVAEERQRVYDAAKAAYDDLPDGTPGRTRRNARREMDAAERRLDEARLAETEARANVSRAPGSPRRPRADLEAALAEAERALNALGDDAEPAVRATAESHVHTARAATVPWGPQHTKALNDAAAAAVRARAALPADADADTRAAAEALVAETADATPAGAMRRQRARRNDAAAAAADYHDALPEDADPAVRAAAEAHLDDTQYATPAACKRRWRARKCDAAAAAIAAYTAVAVDDATTPALKKRAFERLLEALEGTSVGEMFQARRGQMLSDAAARQVSPDDVDREFYDLYPEVKEITESLFEDEAIPGVYTGIATLKGYLREIKRVARREAWRTRLHLASEVGLESKDRTVVPLEGRVLCVTRFRSVARRIERALHLHTARHYLEKVLHHGIGCGTCTPDVDHYVVYAATPVWRNVVVAPSPVRVPTVEDPDERPTRLPGLSTRVPPARSTVQTEDDFDAFLVRHLATGVWRPYSIQTFGCCLLTSYAYSREAFAAGLTCSTEVWFDSEELAREAAEKKRREKTGTRPYVPAARPATAASPAPEVPFPWPNERAVPPQPRLAPPTAAPSKKRKKPAAAAPPKKRPTRKKPAAKKARKRPRGSTAAPPLRRSERLKRPRSSKDG